ncbi:hypothetical protein SPRG_09601 [Saprolegnia parasitica CBS 223.65]|uniref:Uncharacterized protein n=1 Tax=Saprolegnia parasitica (strain CBS 223.65) TaxID=695850 RepID=A0A067CDQ9_SAPPC|nr:hypothetical protein SPRG_09601 [Saprolegnia parasitica CBS 223.65]KDO24957.1 hypothetical protein SPRG_09601 [Saprolegnia parasitica CBS 223.65]|eukprot:XP_012204416.1 hypothetical protein SPRG_09601 [Saprolegnia parasitica CBS 223.65]
MDLKELLKQAWTTVAETWHQASACEKAQYIVIGLLLLVIVVSGAVLVLAFMGLGVSAHTKDVIIEVCSQILNGCFTLSAIATHPMRFYMLLLVLSRREGSHATIQSWFPSLPIAFNSKAHSHAVVVPISSILGVLVVLNLNCFFQYPLTAVMWAYNYRVRPVWVIATCLPLSFVCAIIAGVWQLKLSRRVQHGQIELLENDLSTDLHV